MVQCESTFAKRLKKGQDKNNMSCVQLHHPSHDQRLMSNRLMSYGIQKVAPVQLVCMDCQTDGHTYRHTDARIFGITKSPLAMPWENNILILVIYQ